MRIRYRPSLTRILYTGYFRFLDGTGRHTMPSTPLIRRAAVLALATALTGSGAACSSIGSNTPAPSQSAERPARQGGTLRVALSAEPDKLDPTLARTLVGRTVFNAICEKLYDVDAKLAVVPQLAAALPEFSSDGKTVTVKIRSGVKFADGTPLDAAAVKTSLDRHMTLSGPARKSELSSVASVEVTDPSTVSIKLKMPFVPLTAVLADRAGMILSPTALKAGDDKFATNPVCVGPYKFATRIAQDRIEVVKDPNYYDATKVDSLKADPNLRLLTSDSLGYQGITVNLGNVAGVGKPAGTLAAPYAGPMATNAKVRQAFEMSLDRDAINTVVFRGQFTPTCSPISAASPLSSDAAQACPKH